MDSRAGHADENANTSHQQDEYERESSQQGDETQVEFRELVLAGVAGRHQPLASNTPNSHNSTRCGTSVPRGAVPLEQVSAPTSNRVASPTFNTASRRVGMVSPIAIGMLKNGREVAAATLRSTQAGLTADEASTGHLSSNRIPAALPFTKTSSAARKAPYTQRRGSQKRFWSDVRSGPSDDAEEAHRGTKRSCIGKIPRWNWETTLTPMRDN
jgi:hypothetical protein